MPRRTLTLVGELIRNVDELGDDDLEELLSVLEIGMVEALAESQKRKDKPPPEKRPELRLLVSEAED